MENQVRKMSTGTMVQAAILTALVVILQYMGAFIKLGTFSVSLVLVPIVIGAALCGRGVGAWLGLVFGVVVLLSGDAALFWAVNPLGTIITVLLKGIGCGYLASITYSALEKHSKTAAVALAAVICPLANTGIFLLGCLVFFMDTVASWAAEAGLGGNVAYYMIAFLVGLNFLVELGTNIVLSPVILRLIHIIKKQ